MATTVFGFFLTTVHLLILSQGALFPSQRRASEEKIYCTTEVCKERAKLILSLVNETADPCEDFYEYACGRKPSNGSEWPAKHLETTVKNRLIAIFDRMPNITEAKNATQKAAILYQVCMYNPLTEKEETAALKKELNDKKLGAWPLMRNEKKPFKSMEDTLLSAGLTGLLEYKVDDDTTREQESPVLTIWLPDSVFERPSYLSQFEDIDVVIEHHISSVTTAAKMLRPDLPQEDLLQWTNVTTTFLLDLEEVINTGGPSRHIEKATIEEIESQIPQFPLLQMLNNDLKKVNITFSDQDKIIIQRPDIFKATMNYLLSQDVVDVFNYVGSRAAVAFLRVSSKKFRSAMSAPCTRHLTTHVDADEMQSSECFRLLKEFTPSVLTSLYIKNYFKDETEKKATALLKSIGKTYYYRLKLVPWMDSKTKESALFKLWKMSTYVGYVDSVLNDTRIEILYEGIKDIRRNDSLQDIIKKFDEHKSWSTLSRLRKPHQHFKDDVPYEQVGAYYSRSDNGLAIGAGILDGIFYQSGLPAYINLGAIGMVMAHEITHGYDDGGSDYDAFGEYRNWWTEYTGNEFNEKADCFVDQYEQIFDPVANMTLDGEYKLDENIADNGGLRTAYATYLLNEYGKPQPALPGLDKYTPEQLFFISFALAWCETMTHESMVKQIMMAFHSPNKYRVNVPAQNMEEFSAAFSCKPGSRMRLTDRERCVLW